MNQNQETLRKKRGWDTPLLPVACFALAAATPAHNGYLFAAFFALGWFTAVRLRRPVIAFYGSIGIMVTGYLHLFVGR